MSTIALLHPSWGRPKMAFETFSEWFKFAKDTEQLYYCLGLDESDPKVSEYAHIFSEALPQFRCRLDVGPSTDSVQAVNRIAKTIPEDTELIIDVSDDMGCFPYWDVAIREVFKGVDNYNDPKIAWVQDGYWPFGVVMTYYIANVAFYKRIGYILYEGYSSMSADKDLTEVSRRLGAIIEAPHLTFQHRHYTHGHNPVDATYLRRNNPQEVKKNDQVYIERAKRNFDL